MFYTATYTDARDEKLAMELGASKFIVKPMEMPEFLKEIGTILDEHKERTLPISDGTQKDDRKIDRNYSKVVARKLYKKVGELEKSEKRFRAIFEQAPMGIALIDSETGRFLRVNKKYGEIAGRAGGEMRKLLFTDITHPDDVRAVLDRMRQIREGKSESFAWEHRLVRANGGVRWINMTVVPLWEQTSPEKVHIAIVEDITERKRAEAEKAELETQLRHAQKMEAVGSLAGGIAHDFNNLLFVILGFADMARDEIPASANLSFSINEIIKAGLRAKDLVSQILAFSRETGQERKPTRISPIVKEALRFLRATIPSTIEIRRNIDPETGVVIADPTQIHQIVMNLCANAFHAMRETGGMLEVTLVPDQIESGVSAAKRLDLAPGPYLKLLVRDTGHGMDKQTAEKIFDPYFTTKKTGEGTGLGLSVAHGIVKSHNGHIAVQSELGRGTVFEVWLPRLVSEAEVENRPAIAPYPIGVEKILIVDDEASIAKMESQILESLGYGTTALTDSNAALQTFLNAPEAFDLVITDLTMPGLTGIDLSREIHAIRPDIPIIILTGMREQVNEEKIAEIGVRQVVTKPVLKRQLAEIVRDALSEKKSKFDRIAE